MVLLGFSAQACGQSIEAIEEPNTKSATVEAVAPQTSVTMTLEDIRAEQVKLEAQIAKIKAKGELERADKIALLKLTRKLLIAKKSETRFQEEIIKNQKEQLAREFALVREQIK